MQSLSQPNKLCSIIPICIYAIPERRHSFTYVPNKWYNACARRRLMTNGRKTYDFATWCRHEKPCENSLSAFKSDSRRNRTRWDRGSCPRDADKPNEDQRYSPSREQITCYREHRGFPDRCHTSDTRGMKLNGFYASTNRSNKGNRGSVAEVSIVDTEESDLSDKARRHSGRNRDKPTEDWRYSPSRELITCHREPGGFPDRCRSSDTQGMKLNCVDTSANRSNKENRDRVAKVSVVDAAESYLSDKAGGVRNRDMVQKYLVSKRDRYSFEMGAKTDKYRRHNSSRIDPKSVPQHWDLNQLPKVGYKLVDLDKNSNEYEKIKYLFHSTLATVTILSIERIQNPSLWNVYQRQKKEMNKCKDGRVVDEIQLFHATSDSLIDTICQQNFDHQLNGNMNVKGISFGKDAYYCHIFSPKEFFLSHVMFLARVLVENFKKNGSSSSCVCVEKHQVYPEYVIKYI
ncbi:poly [ADP-ribose] polymerase 12 [Pelobates cultripes]|uniref:Poly [ADP-ribose] polymerase n=1 Tax=Pelobates cultripes TaxID=61616 RepID=A0AAD1VYF1_PELCU|nr:poly [ADP-ribose] polymerase 12 [Pelobates cultripes]